MRQPPGYLLELSLTPGDLILRNRKQTKARRVANGSSSAYGLRYVRGRAIGSLVDDVRDNKFTPVVEKVSVFFTQKRAGPKSCRNTPPQG
jgi:hypothetical protein